VNRFIDPPLNFAPGDLARLRRFVSDGPESIDELVEDLPELGDLDERPLGPRQLQLQQLSFDLSLSLDGFTLCPLA